MQTRREKSVFSPTLAAQTYFYVTWEADNGVLTRKLIKYLQEHPSVAMIVWYRSGDIKTRWESIVSLAANFFRDIAPFSENMGLASVYRYGRSVEKKIYKLLAMQSDALAAYRKWKGLCLNHHVDNIDDAPDTILKKFRYFNELFKIKRDTADQGKQDQPCTGVDRNENERAESLESRDSQVNGEETEREMPSKNKGGKDNESKWGCSEETGGGRGGGGERDGEGEDDEEEDDEEEDDDEKEEGKGGGGKGGGGKARSAVDRLLRILRQGPDPDPQDNDSDATPPPDSNRFDSGHEVHPGKTGGQFLDMRETALNTISLNQVCRPESPKSKGGNSGGRGDRVKRQQKRVREDSSSGQTGNENDAHPLKIRRSITSPLSRRKGIVH